MKDEKIDFESVIAENERRRAALDHDEYNPLTGVGCWGERTEVAGALVPRLVVERCPDYATLDATSRDKLRIVEDFEFWCARCVTIKDKMRGCNVRFTLNKPQRRLLAVMESQRVAGRPIRVILLKARQWGGSTLVQMYLAWMQLVRHKGWDSLICGHYQATSKSIKRMYNLLLRHYPRELLDDEMPRFTKLEGQPNVQQIEQRECLVITGTARSEDAVRGFDIAMAHLSEVAFWKESKMHSPDALVRSVCGSVILKPETVIVLESTADGVGNYFYDEWLRAEMGRSDKEPVFVPWHEVGIYAKEVDDPAALWSEMDEYERTLWQDGLTLEQINWYHYKRREYRSHDLMMAEYPGSASEAFTTTGNNPFDRDALDRMVSESVMDPVLVGEIQAAGLSGPEAKRDIRLVPERHGKLKVWELPMRSGPMRTRYIVVVDVGGKWEGSDYSVIAVLRMQDAVHKEAVVAQWRGHIDHDMLAWKAMQMAEFYNKALLVVESNTLTNEAARAGESEYILESVYRVYNNVYQRGRRKLGFHTNVKTKRAAVTALIAAVRVGRYLERDIEAVNEMRDYEERNGRYEARAGKHDDILMTRAIGMHVLDEIRKPQPSPDLSLANNGWMVSPV